MVKWTIQEYANHKARRSAKGAELERGNEDEQVATDITQEASAGRIKVIIDSYRVGLLDPDNLCVKYHLDALRYAGLIPDDRPEDINLQIKQHKVSRRKEERTEITLERED